MSLSVFEICLIIAILIFGFIGIYFVVELGKHWRRQDATNKYKIDLTYDTSKVEEILDATIFQMITDYVTKELAFREDISYINDDLQNEIRNNVISQLSMRLPPSFMNKLELIYNSEDIPDIIADKIYMAVTAYVISNNAGKAPVPNSENNDITK